MQLKWIECLQRRQKTHFPVLQSNQEEANSASRMFFLFIGDYFNRNGPPNYNTQYLRTKRQEVDRIL